MASCHRGALAPQEGVRRLAMDQAEQANEMKARQAGSARHLVERDRLVVPAGDEVGGEQDPAQQLLAGRRLDAVDALRLPAQRPFLAQASRTRAIRCARSSGSGRAAARAWAIANRWRPAGPSRGRRLSAKAARRASRRTTSSPRIARRTRRRRRPRRSGRSSPHARRRPGRRPPASGCAEPDPAGSSRSRGRPARASCPRRGGPDGCARPGSRRPAAPRGTPASAPPEPVKPGSWARSNAYTSFWANFCAT